MNPAIARVLAAPLADAPRRAFADAIGGERGAFVHAQLDLAWEQWGPGRGDPERLTSLRTRAAALLATNERAWAGRAPEVATQWTFVRGFVERVVVPAREALARGDVLFAEDPVSHVKLTGVRDVPMDELFAAPWLDRVLALDLSGERIGDEGVVALASSPRVGGLVWLSLYDDDVRMAGADALAASPNVPALRYVAFGKNHVDVVAQPAGVDADGAVLGVELPPDGEALAGRHGLKRWQRCDARHVRQWPPDLYDLVEIER